MIRFFTMNSSLPNAISSGLSQISSQSGSLILHLNTSILRISSTLKPRRNLKKLKESLLLKRLRIIKRKEKSDDLITQITV